MILSVSTQKKDSDSSGISAQGCNYPKMKLAFERACEFLKDLVCDIGKIDAEIHPVLSNKFNFPPFDPVPDCTEGFQYMSHRATIYPELTVIYKKAIDIPKFFILVSIIHRLTKKKLDVHLALVQRSKHNTDEVKFKISRRIQWLFEVSKFWWIIIQFLKTHR